MRIFRRFVEDESGVTAIVLGLMAGILLPAGISAFYFVQLSASKDILGTVCPRVLAAYIGAPSTEDRAPAMATIIDGLIDPTVIEKVTTSVTLVSGVETYAQNDAEANRPIYELTLGGTDTAARDSDLGEGGGKIAARCRATLAIEPRLGIVEETRELQVIAGAPPSDTNPNWGEGATDNATNDDLRAYVTQKISVDGSEKWLTAEVWRRDDGRKQWLFPTTDNLRLSGTFVGSNKALLTRVRPTYFVNLTPKDSSKTWITKNDTNAPTGYPAIRPVCYDPDDPADNDGFGWESDPALLPGGSGKGYIGSLPRSGDRYDHKYLAIVGVDRYGKYEVTNDDTWNNLTNWLFQLSLDGGNASKRVSGRQSWSKFANSTSPFLSYSMWSNNAQAYRTLTPLGYWHFKTLFNKYANGASTPLGETEAALYKYKLTMKISCPGYVDTRTAVPMSE